MDKDRIFPARRGFFGRMAGVVVLGAAGLAAARTEAATGQADLSAWPGKLPGRHKQVVDGYAANHGTPLQYAVTFLIPNPGPGMATAVVVLRAGAMPIALNSAMWDKYKIGESLKIDDPETKAPAVKNPFLGAKPGVLPLDAMAVDKMLAAGAIFGACNMALRHLSGVLAGKAGVSPEEAAKEWTANIIPGITVIPSGTWGVNRAQEAGCTYCSAG